MEWYSDVFDLVFHDLDRKKANTLWKEQLEKGTKRRAKEMKPKEESSEGEAEDYISDHLS